MEITASWECVHHVVEVGMDETVLSLKQKVVAVCTGVYDAASIALFSTAGEEIVPDDAEMSNVALQDGDHVSVVRVVTEADSVRSSDCLKQATLPTASALLLNNEDKASLLVRCIALNPNNGPAYAHLGVLLGERYALLEDGTMTASEYLFKRALSEDSEEYRARSGLALQLKEHETAVLDDGSEHSAVELMMEAVEHARLKEAPACEQARLCADTASVLERSGQHQEAIKSLRDTAASLHPTHHTASSAALQIASLQRFLLDNPLCGLAYNNLACLLSGDAVVSLHKDMTRTDLLKRAQLLSPQSGAVYANLAAVQTDATVCLESGERLGRVALLAAALQRAERAEAYLMLASEATTVEQRQRALMRCIELKNDATLPLAYYRLANTIDDEILLNNKKATKSGLRHLAMQGTKRSIHRAQQRNDSNLGALYASLSTMLGTTQIIGLTDGEPVTKESLLLKAHSHGYAPKGVRGQSSIAEPSVKYFTSCIERNGSSAAYNGLAECLDTNGTAMVRGVVWTRQALLEKAVQITPHTSAPWRNLAEELHTTGQQRVKLDSIYTVEQLLVRAIEIDEDDAAAYSLLSYTMSAGVCRLCGALWSEADLLLRSIALDPNVSVVWQDLGHALLRTQQANVVLHGTTHTPKDLFQRALELDPSDGYAAQSLGQSLADGEEVQLQWGVLSGLRLSKEQMVRRAVEVLG